MQEVTIAYGMTETSPVSTQTSRDDPIERRVSTVGRVQPHVEIRIIDADGATESKAVKAHALEMFEKARNDWTASGGELISLPPEEQASMLKTLASVGDDVSKTKPQLGEAYKVVTSAAQRAH